MRIFRGFREIFLVHILIIQGTVKEYQNSLLLLQFLQKNYRHQGISQRIWKNSQKIGKKQKQRRNKVVGKYNKATLISMDPFVIRKPTLVSRSRFAANINTKPCVPPSFLFLFFFSPSSRLLSTRPCVPRNTMKVDADHRGNEERRGEEEARVEAIVPHALRPCLGFHRVDDFCGRPQSSARKREPGMSPGATSLRGWHVIRLQGCEPRELGEHEFHPVGSPFSLPSFPSSFLLRRILSSANDAWSKERTAPRCGIRAIFKSDRTEQPRDLRFLEGLRTFISGIGDSILIRDGVSNGLFCFEWIILYSFFLSFLIIDIFQKLEINFFDSNFLQFWNYKLLIQECKNICSKIFLEIIAIKKFQLDKIWKYIYHSPYILLYQYTLLSIYYFSK